MDGGTRLIERRLGEWARARLSPALSEFVMFGLKQGWAALFGGLFLAALLLSDAIWQPHWPLARYDALLIFALGVQTILLWARLETWAEVRVIFLFHLTGTAMEIFKVAAGSWAYPEPGLVKLWGVPLFSGFMYASVGSYMARAIRIFEMRFAPFPPLWASWALAAAIYANFFAHHYLPDMRLALFAATVLIYGRCRVWYYVGTLPRWMPLPLAGLLTAVALFVAETVGTRTGTWLYAGQLAGEPVRWAKLGSWYLLLFVAFATVTLVSRQGLSRKALKPPPRSEARLRGAPDALSEGRS